MAPINIMVELGRDRSCQIVQDKLKHNCRIDSRTNCWLASVSKNGDGYCQVWTKPNSAATRGLTGRSAQKAFLLHIVSFVAVHGQNPTEQVSHLCDRRHCFNPDHLVDETAQRNNSRKGCPGPIYCGDHGHLIVNLCAHEPPCLRLIRDDIKCCIVQGG